MLTKRLAACAEYVGGGGIVCDVGTDHAYLPIYLVQSGVCKTAYACDIAEGPLECARENVERAGLSKSIRLVQSDGLREVPLEGVSDIVIAGMGGELIAQILSGVCAQNINFVLQPNTRERELVRWLYENGYEITRSRACEDGKHVYLVLNAKYCGKKRELSDAESILGRLDPSDRESVKYIRRQINKLSRAAVGMRRSPGMTGESERLEALCGELSQKIEIDGKITGGKHQ